MTNVEQVLKKYNSSASGLSSAQAQENQKYGINQLQETKKQSFIARFFNQFKNLMIIVLLISAVVSSVVSVISGELDGLFEGGLVLVIVIINAIIGVIQENKAEVALSLLTKQSSPHSRVIRDNKVVLLASSEVVVGDVVLIKAGEFVPADMLLIESTNLKVNESSLTGESEPATKDAKAVVSPDCPLAERANMCFGSTSVTYGSAKGVVVAVGKNAEIGKIANLLSTKREKTPLEKNMERIGKVITYGVLIIVAIVFITQLILSKSQNYMQSFLTAVALAVAAIPESLPAVITIIMALGVEKLAKHGAIVKTLSSVETLGSVTALCTDKTGTLTQNQMQVESIYVSGKLTKPSGLSLQNPDFVTMLDAITYCNNCSVSANNTIMGDATETSLVRFSSGFRPNFQPTHKRIFEIPFDSTRKLMSTINVAQKEAFMFTKGAPDYLLSRCKHILIDGKIIPLSGDILLSVTSAHKKMADRAERVIAIAYKVVQTSADYAEDNLVLVGLVGIIDPPRPQAYKAIEKCFSAGLKPIMITGDHPDTAFAIAKELKIAKSKNQVLTGQDIDGLSDKNLAKIIGEYSVFARVTPAHKTKIVKALKKSGQIVGFTGDGINDAPSIKHADIGVCMGSGTDVTKSVSDLIVADDDFSCIVLAIEQGRTIFNNIQKTLLFLLSTNMVEVLGIFVSAIVMPSTTFLLPSQILFINLVTDSLPAFALGLEKSEPDIMQKPPRPANSTIFSGIGWHILWQGFAQTFAIMIMFVVAYNKCSNQVATTMVFATICLMQIIHAINCKTLRSLTKINVLNNKTFNISFVSLFALIMFVCLVPPCQTVFGLASLNILQWLIVFAVSISIVPLVELVKYILNHNFAGRKTKLTKKAKTNIQTQMGH